MPKIWELTTPEGKLNWATIYFRIKKKRWSPPEKDKHSSELESLPEMQEIMEEVPNYTISVEGRK